MQTTRLTKISFAAVAGLLVAASSVQAQVLLNNDFTFASRTSNPNGGTPSSGATAVTGLDATSAPRVA